MAASLKQQLGASYLHAIEESAAAAWAVGVPIGKMIARIRRGVTSMRSERKQERAAKRRHTKRRGTKRRRS